MATLKLKRPMPAWRKRFPLLQLRTEAIASRNADCRRPWYAQRLGWARDLEGREVKVFRLW